MTAIPAAWRRAAESFEDYLRVERGAQPATVQAYRAEIRRYLAYLAWTGIRRPEDVRPAHVADALALRAEAGVAPATINRTLAALRHFHRFLVREGLARTNPASLVDGPARGLLLPKALGEEEVARLIEAASDPSPVGLRDRALLELLYGAGLRVSELVGLDVEDVDVEDRLVRCLGKGGKERVVPMGSAAAEAVRRYLRLGRGELLGGARPTPALFLGRGGRRLSRQSAWTRVRRYARQVSPNARVFPHALRHSFATHLVARGADLRVVQEALGHARLHTTQVYTLVTRSRLKDSYEEAHPRGRRRGVRRRGGTE